MGVAEWAGCRTLKMAEQLEDEEDDVEQRQQEMESLLSIYGEDMKVLKAGREYLVSLSLINQQ